MTATTPDDRPSLETKVRELLRTHERGVAMTEGALARISDSAREDIVDELERARSWHERFAGELREVLS